MNFTNSRALQRKSHQLIPGGSHTYAKGDDQFPVESPGFFERGSGCQVWDVDGNQFIEYGMGCRAVTLGHAYPAVIQAVAAVLDQGTNFSRPTALELACAEELLGLISGAEMVKFAKDGSSTTTAAVKLARASTGRDRVAICSDHPFLSVHDWFIGTTALDAGIPRVVQELTVGFRYNDLDSVRELFQRYPGEIACVILEPAKYEDPSDYFLHRVQELCEQHGAVFVLDEMITGFRWHNGGAQAYYDIVPDLSCFGKAMANGFSLSALVGKRPLMELGGLLHDQPRVFLLSTTHGAESTGLAAGLATMRVYQNEPVVDTLFQRGERLLAGIQQSIAHHQLQPFVGIHGKPCCLVYSTRDENRQPSQAFRCLLLQEITRRGVFGPSLIISYSHTEQDIDHTIQAFHEALGVYAQALREGVEKYLVGPPSQSVYTRTTSLDSLPGSLSLLHDNVQTTEPGPLGATARHGTS